MKYKELIESLNKNRNEKFAHFSKTLSNSDYQVIGVKNPELRKIIKEHKNDEELILEEFELGKFLEIDFIYFGLALSRLLSIDDQLNFLLEKGKLIKSWAITDTLKSFLKKLSFAKFWDFFKKMHKSPFIYDRRIAYAFGLSFRKDREILRIFNYLNENEVYMVMMAEAWLLSFVAIEFPNEVFNYLSFSKDNALKLKTISKISDSFRFDKEIKDKFKSLR